MLSKYLWASVCIFIFTECFGLMIKPGQLADARQLAVQAALLVWEA